MNTKDKIFWISYIYLAVLVLIRFIPIIDPGSRTWGFNHLIFLPDIYSYCLFFIATVALVIPFIRSAEKAGTALADWFSDKFLDGRQRYLYRFLFVAIMATLFVVFTAPTHFLGDGYTVIKNLVSETGILVKWSEIGIIRLMWVIRELLGPPDEETSLLAFQIVSVVSGAITVYFIFLISRIASENSLKRFIIFVATFFSGLLLLFFGYAEYYPVVWVFMTGFIYFSLKFLKSGRDLLAAWLFLIIGIILHIQLAIFVPAIFYLTFSKGSGRIFYSRFKKPIWGITGLIFISGLSLLIYKYTTNLYVEDIFLPLLKGKPVYPDYAILSVPHLLDIFNEFILISPLLFLFIILAGRSFRRIFINKPAIYLALATIGSLLFMFIIDPKLSFPRDWDLFSMSSFSFILLSVTLINKNRIQHYGKLIISTALILSIYPLPFLLTNLNRDRSEKYIESLIKLDTAKSQSSITVLSSYYKENDYREKFDSLIFIYNREFMQDRLISSALDAVVSGDLESALRFNQLIKPDKFNGDYQRLLSMINYASGRYEKALYHIDRAIQLRKFASEYHWSRSRIYYSMKKYELALVSLREAHKLNPSRLHTVDAMAMIYDLINRPDSCVYYAGKTLELDSTRFQSYRYIIKWLALTGQSEKAEKYKSIYARYTPADSVQQKNLKLLDSLIANQGR
ncbi:MAG TPA: hypothetical protein ENL22_04165 [candidate division Zixibacteria bacterium]|nr:hypothetical protein [candidate division Zixibacteria bacterium]